MIRLATLEDLEFIHELYMHPQVNPYLLYENMPIEEFKPIFEDLLAKQIKFVYQKDQQRIGMFKLVPLTYRSDHVSYLGGLAIHPDASGKGEGQNMLAEILAFAKTKGTLRMELTVDTINHKAIRLYDRLGFKKEGILKKYTRLKSENRFLDEELMAYLY